GTFATTLTAVDFNQDGHVDLVVADSPFAAGQPGALLFLHGNGDGTFKDPGPSDRDGAIDNPTSLAVADVNNDGFPDIVAVTSPSVAGSPSRIDVFLNSFGVSRRLVSFTPFSDNTVIQSAILTDLTQNAIPDLLISVKTPSTDPTSRASTTDNLFA